MAPEPTLATLRARIAGLERPPPPAGKRLGFGIPAIDSHLPWGGLPAGALHEIAGADAGHGGAATLLIAGLLARHRGPVVWALRGRDLFAPGLAGAGLHPDRVVFVDAGGDVLAVMEDALRHPGLAAVVGEVDRLTLIASRRLQLAAEHTGGIGLVLRRFRTAGPQREAALAEPNAAATRWRVTTLPSPPPLAHAPAVPGLARARWRLDLVRCRGGAPASWIVEACDAKGGFRLPAELPGRTAPQARRGIG